MTSMESVELTLPGTTRFNKDGMAYGTPEAIEKSSQIMSGRHPFPKAKSFLNPMCKELRAPFALVVQTSPSK